MTQPHEPRPMTCEEAIGLLLTVKRNCILLARDSGAPSGLSWADQVRGEQAAATLTQALAGGPSPCAIEAPALPTPVPLDDAAAPSPSEPHYEWDPAAVAETAAPADEEAQP